jgi:phenylpyruvate tautomerase PptA (4-oxalocrotonate tautomerase family)
MDVLDVNNATDVTAGPQPLSRRAVLMAGTVAAGTLAAAPPAAAEADTTVFGAPLVELVVPAGVLTAEQKAAMIAGITDVLNTALKQPPDPSRRMFVEIMETAENGFGVNGRVFVPRAK